MPASLVLIKTIESVNLVFGLDWFAILGGTVSRDVRRIVRQQKATHIVHTGDDAASVGVASLFPGKRSTVLYSAAQLVAERFSTGVVALVVQLDDSQWWMVAVHEGAVIARTDHVFDTIDDAKDRIAQLRQAYPNLLMLNDKQEQPSLSELVEARHTAAKLRRVARGNRFVSPRYGLVLLVGMLYLLYQSGVFADIFSNHDRSAASKINAEQAWQETLHELAGAHWVHGVAGSAGVLVSLYALPVELEGWRLHNAECIAQKDQWRCHADYSRDDPQTSNERFLSAAPGSWDVSFTPLEQARVGWNFDSAGRNLTQTNLYGAQYIERSLFSALQAIRPAFALMTIDAPERLPVPAPFDEYGQAIPRPPGFPVYRIRSVRIQAPLRSISLLLPHARAMTWRRVVLSVDPKIRPDLTRSRLNVTLQGVLYEND